MKIGVFDSGIGGLSVLHEARKVLPDEHYLYYADTAHVPYGTKPKEEIRGYIFEAVTFLRDQGCEAVVVACNTATSVAIDDLRAAFSLPIIGMEPAVKPAVQANQHQRVLVFATEMTLREPKVHNLVSKVDNAGIVDYLSLQELVLFSERFEFGEDTFHRRPGVRGNIVDGDDKRAVGVGHGRLAQVDGSGGRRGGRGGGVFYGSYGSYGSHRSHRSHRSHGRRKWLRGCRRQFRYGVFLDGWLYDGRRRAFPVRFQFHALRYRLRHHRRKQRQFFLNRFPQRRSLQTAYGTIARAQSAQRIEKSSPCRVKKVNRAVVGGT